MNAVKWMIINNSLIIFFINLDSMTNSETIRTRMTSAQS